MSKKRLKFFFSLKNRKSACQEEGYLVLYYVHGALAQLGARHTGSVEVTGSNPVCSILFLLINDSVNYL